jgi:hypothetical protein
MKLIWQKTGDYIVCDPLDHKFVEYWLENQNKFVWQTTNCFPQQQLISELSYLVEQIQKDLNKVKIKLIETPIDFNQNTLNILHRRWVQLHIEYPNISTLFDTNFKISLNRINKALHELEESWSLKLSSDNTPLTAYDKLPRLFGQANINLPYENLGRSSYNKWLNFDESLETTDTNNFNELYNKISINLNRSFIIDPPKDYVNWTRNKGFEAVPNKLQLANFINLDTKQDIYRSLFMKNFVLDLNDVIFTT